MVEISRLGYSPTAAEIEEQGDHRRRRDERLERSVAADERPRGDERQEGRAGKHDRPDVGGVPLRDLRAEGDHGDHDQGGQDEEDKQSPGTAASIRASSSPSVFIVR